MEAAATDNIGSRAAGQVGRFGQTWRSVSAGRHVA